MSSEGFGDAAAKLSGAASQLLGWRPDEFWNATPAELAAALTCVGAETEPPASTLIAALREQFPDD